LGFIDKNQMPCGKSGCLVTVFHNPSELKIMSKIKLKELFNFFVFSFPKGPISVCAKNFNGTFIELIIIPLTQAVNPNTIVGLFVFLAAKLLDKLKN
jgi:hypothetical protein